MWGVGAGLTAGDGEHQVPLLRQLAVQPRRAEQEVRDGGQAGPAQGGLDVPLGQQEEAQVDK